MYSHQIPGHQTKGNTGFQQCNAAHSQDHIRSEGLWIRERIDEILMMCDRDNPVYEQISSYGIALYALGCFDCPDLMSVGDIDACEAGEILQSQFSRVCPADIPNKYDIMEYPEKYLLVVGDPLFPEHFAVLTDSLGQRPFFSKLPFFGSGFDSIEELMEEFIGIDGITFEDFHYFQKKTPSTMPSVSMGRIYIVR